MLVFIYGLKCPIAGFVILHCVVDGERWQDIERSFIAAAEDRGWRLTNSTAGGEGLDYLDPADSERHRQNLSRALKRVWATPERKEFARQRSLRAWADPEAKSRRAISMVVALGTPKAKLNLSAASTEMNSRLDVKAVKSKKLKALWADPERRCKREARINRDKQSVSAKGRWE